MRESKQAFTLIEIVVVVMILGVLAGLALPNYSKSVRRAHEQDAVMQLHVIHLANKDYFYQEDKFLDTGGATQDKSFINTGLGTNLLGAGITYTYVSNGGASYNAYAAWDDPDNANDFTVRITNAALTPTNPCCSSGACPSLGAC